MDKGWCYVIMPRAKRKSNYQSFQSSKGGRMVAIYFDMMESKAWAELSGNDIKLYLHMLKKYTAKFDKGILIKSNKEDICMTRDEYTKFMAKNTFEKGIDKLINLGFVKVMEYQYKCGIRKLIIYGFSDMWQYYGTNKFHIKDCWKRSINRVSI